MIESRGSGHVEFVVSRVRVWHPEFGYVGTSSASRLFMAFVVCGLFAGAISVAIFNPEPDHDPMDAMALAPEALIAPKPDQLATQSEIRPVTNEPSAKKTDEKGTNASRKEGWIKPTCRENLGEVPEGDCTPVRVVRVRPVRAVNERPLIAAVPIGHRDDATAEFDLLRVAFFLDAAVMNGSDEKCNLHRRLVTVCCPELGEFVQ
jgi:hypothetical protein